MSRSHASELFCKEWTVQKAGLKPEQNEDACLTREFEREPDSPRLLVAIADGATEAVYSRLWAKKLVEAAGPDWPSLSDDGLGEQLRQVCKAFSPIEPGEDVPWFVRNKYMDQGSQATLLVVTLTGSKDADSFYVRAVSVGDCCLILFKSNGEILSFPMHSSDEFGVNPVLLGNRIPKPATYDRWEWPVDLGDMILIGSDAVSKWALQCLERQQSGLLFETLLDLLSADPLDFNPSVEAHAPADSQPDAGEMGTDENHAAHLRDAEKPAKRRGWLSRLWPWSNDEPQETSEPADAQSYTPEVTATLPNDVGELLAPRDDEQADEPSAGDSRLKFEQFIEYYRAADSELPMRNDDSTLIVCVPVRHTSAGREREALQAMSRLKAAVAARLKTALPAGEVNSD